MALSTPTTIARVKARVAAGLTPMQRNTLDYDIMQCIDPALERYAKMAAQSKRHKLPRKEVSFTSASGVLDLSANTSILPETITSLRVSGSTISYVRAKTQNDLLATNQTDTVIWLLDSSTSGASIRLRNTDGSLTSHTGTAVLVSANFVPTLAQLATQDEGDFIDMVVTLFNERNAIIKAEDEEVVQI